MVVLIRWLGLPLAGILLSLSTHAEYRLGAKHRVENDLFDFDAFELRIDGRPVGFIAEGSKPVDFSSQFLVYAGCRVDKSTRKPIDEYCTDWTFYDYTSKSTKRLVLPGLKSTSTPSFSWPYIAYVQVQGKITKKNFQEGLVEVSCVVVEWPSKKFVAQQQVKVNVGHFETDAPGSFLPPRFVMRDGAQSVTCLEDSGKTDGNAIATLQILK